MYASEIVVPLALDVELVVGALAYSEGRQVWYVSRDAHRYPAGRGSRKYERMSIFARETSSSQVHQVLRPSVSTSMCYLGSNKVLSTLPALGRQPVSVFFVIHQSGLQTFAPSVLCGTTVVVQTTIQERWSKSSTQPTARKHPAFHEHQLHPAPSDTR